MKFKITVADPKTRKTYQKEVDQGQSGLLGKKIGEEFSGDNIGLNGYKLKLTGGSDRQGFPMRRDVDGTGRRRILLSHPPGYHPQRKGQRKRKGVRGNTVSQDIIQVNAKVVKGGKKKLKDLLGKEKKKPKGGKEEKAKGKEAGKKKKVKGKPEKKEEKAEKKPKKEEKKSEKVKQPEEEKQGKDKSSKEKKPEEREQKEKSRKKEKASKEKKSDKKKSD